MTAWEPSRHGGRTSYAGAVDEEKSELRVILVRGHDCPLSTSCKESHTRDDEWGQEVDDDSYDRPRAGIPAHDD